MPFKRLRPSGNWEFIVRRKGLLPRPLSLSFKSESEGDEYCRRLEALLDRGIVPAEFARKAGRMDTIGEAITEYKAAVHISAPDAKILEAIEGAKGCDLLAAWDYATVEGWIADMKRIDKKAPSTIRHYVGALARCFDWLSTKHPAAMPVNHIRRLPRRYATYSDADAKIAGVKREEKPRDKRLAPEDEKRIAAVLDGKEWPLRVMFRLALESGMRMREIYTLEAGQVDLAAKVVRLEKTKNGDKRQVPLTTPAAEALAICPKEGNLFPYWDNRPESLDGTTSKLSQKFAAIFEEAGVPEFVFHGLRHEATSRLYERTTLSDVEIAKILGWKSLRMALRYSHLRANHFDGKLW
jgi:integrase